MQTDVKVCRVDTNLGPGTDRQAGFVLGSHLQRQNLPGLGLREFRQLNRQVPVAGRLACSFTDLPAEIIGARAERVKGIQPRGIQ